MYESTDTKAPVFTVSKIRKNKHVKKNSFGSYDSTFVLHTPLQFNYHRVSGELGQKRFWVDRL